MPDGRGRLAPALAELIIPVAAIAFTAYYIWSVRDGPWEAKFSAYFIGIALIVVCTVFLSLRLLAFASHRAKAPVPRLGFRREVVIKRVLLLALTFGYIILLDRGGGFTLSNFIFLTGGILLLSGGDRPVRAIGLAAALALSGYLVFIVAFETRFPEGPFEEAMERLVDQE
jgi:hypothetical protein